VVSRGYRVLSPIVAGSLHLDFGHARLASSGNWTNIELMTRLRALAAFLGCLSIFAGTLSFALAAPAAMADRHTAAMTAPCPTCNDCDKAPCPMPMDDCIQMHVSAGPALLAAALEAWASPHITLQWSPVQRPLRGLSPPPDPFPPRA